MIIVNIKSGLGNQMFQYALYVTLKKNGKDAKICTLQYKISKKKKSVPQHGKEYLIEDIFGTKEIVATPNEATMLGTIGDDIVSKIRRKLKMEKKTHIYEERIQYSSIDDLLKYDNVFLDGYWQRFDLFKSAKKEVREVFSFSKPLKGNNIDIASRIQSGYSVAIHVRRGDFLQHSIYTLQGMDYFTAAIDAMNHSFPSPVTYYVFSDDIIWCKEHFSSLSDEFVYIDWNTGKDSFIDMQLMSMCQGNIVANSSFSVWAAWLNADKKKKIIRPKHYYNDLNMDQKYVWPSDWESI